MKIYRTKDYDEMSKKAAHIIAAQIVLKPDCVLGLATGSTPVGTYKNLVELYKNGDLDFSTLSSCNLDEYRGLSPENDQSYRYFMNTNLFDHVNIRKDHTFVPDGLQENSDQACQMYEQIIRDLGGIDLQLLGLGHNGHIGFNEPAEDFPKITHCVDLTESTIQANKRFFEKESDVPRQAYTMGIGTIMSAKKILVVVSGEDNMDEITLTGATTVSEIRDGAVTTFTITPEQFGMKRVSLEELRGGSGGENAKITRAILDGTERGAKRDIVLLNAGATLYVGGVAESMEAGVKLAAETIDSGAAARKLKELVRVSNT